MELLEQTGYSYSGIADLISNSEPEKVKILIEEIEKTYQDAKHRQAELENELRMIQEQRALCINALFMLTKPLN